MSLPNIVLIVSRGHRWDSSGYAGHSDVRTPNLDALARHGLVFDQALAAYPEPAIAEAALVTGLLSPPPGPHEGEGTAAALGAYAPVRLLASVGYTSAWISALATQARATQHGFDYAFAVDKRPGEASASEDDPVTRSVGEVLRFIRRAESPFFVMATLPGPDAAPAAPGARPRAYAASQLQLPPGWAPDDSSAQTTGAPLAPEHAEALSRYYAAITHVDKQIGRILALLGGRAHTNNAIVYTSLCGGNPLLPAASLPCARYARDDFLRVPLIVAGYAGQRAGTRDDALIESIDVMPTLLEIAGVGPALGLQGSSFVRRLRSARGIHRKVAYAEAPGGLRLARTQSHKLVESPQAACRALYDLEQDPRERCNLYGRPDLAVIQRRLYQEIKDRATASALRL